MDGELWHLVHRVQDGVVSRAQLLDGGLREHDVDRLVRRRELSRVHRGVYVVHTGPLTWDQRAWAAVLVHRPCALTLSSALPDPPRDAAVHVAVDSDRTVPAVAGVVAHRTARWRERLAPHATRPRLALPEAAVELAARTSDPWESYAVFARVCWTRQTDPAAIGVALRGRRGVAHRDLLLDLLDDLAQGACSVLEREYLARVERAHGLPCGSRQVRARHAKGTVYRDVEHEDLGVVVELDGRAVHGSARQRDLDLDRDLEAAGDDRLTVRLGWRQVLHVPCRTAELLAAVLQRRGWTGELVACPSCPPPACRTGPRARG